MPGWGWDDALLEEKRVKELMYKMGLYKDEVGIYRLKGRLTNSDLHENTKFPIYLDQNSYFTELIVFSCHDKVKHSKVKDTLNELRSVYWVPQGRRTVTRVLKRCYVCIKAESKAFKPLPTAPLPAFRVKTHFPFTSTGIDFFGPMFVKNIYNDADGIYKAYGVLYTCATSRAVHLDLVPDTSCLTFVRSLKRFIARYGISKLFISDNGTFLSDRNYGHFCNK